MFPTHSRQKQAQKKQQPVANYNNSSYLVFSSVMSLMPYDWAVQIVVCADNRAHDSQHCSSEVLCSVPRGYQGKICTSYKAMVCHSHKQRLSYQQDCWAIYFADCTPL